MAQHHGSSWTERTTAAAPVHAADADDLEHHFKKQGFQHPHTSLGVAGHIVHMAGVFVPLVAGELVTDAAKYKKTVRLASIGTALAYEALYVMREHKRQQEQEAKLAACRGRD